jgi:hypothetical protein
VLETTVSGKGVFAFKWKVDCEWDDTGDASWDRLVVFTNNIEAARIDGLTDWETMYFKFLDDGVHTIRWEFVKDDYDEEWADCSDCGWISDICWYSAEEQVKTLPILESTATEFEVALAIIGMKDGKVVEEIVDADSYNRFRTWVDNHNIKHQSVFNSSFAWLSYALDVDSLIAAAPKEGDVVIDTFENAPTDGSFEFTVKIDGIAVGENAFEANIRKVFEVEGRKELSKGAFLTEVVEINAAAPENKNIKFSVTPKVENGEKPNSFFFRVKMK